MEDLGAADERTAREAAVDAIAGLEELTKSVAWGMLVAFIDDQTTRRVNEVMLTMASNEEERRKQEYIKGEYNAFVSLKTFVTEKLRVSRETLELYREAARVEGEE